MGKKFTLTIENADGVDVIVQSDDFNKIVILSNQLTGKEPQQLEGKPKVVLTK